MTAFVTAPVFHHDTDQLLLRLHEELFLLEEALANFYQLPTERRPPAPADYIEQIRVRRELLHLLSADV